MTDYSRLRTPFVNMSFTPDVPSNALGPNEYNSGLNVEADVRGARTVPGAGRLYVEAGFPDGCGGRRRAGDPPPRPGRSRGALDGADDAGGGPPAGLAGGDRQPGARDQCHPGHAA